MTTPPEAPAVTETTPPAEPSTAGKLADRAASIRQDAQSWWGFVATPTSPAEAWRRSALVIPERVPAESNRMAALWWWSNRTDRVLLIGLGCLLLMAAGGVLWCAERPTRRWGLTAVVVLLLVASAVAGG